MRAFLVCTIYPGAPLPLAEVESEGEGIEAIERHVKHCGEDHRPFCITVFPELNDPRLTEYEMGRIREISETTPAGSKSFEQGPTPMSSASQRYTPEGWEDPTATRDAEMADWARQRLGGGGGSTQRMVDILERDSVLIETIQDGVVVDSTEVTRYYYETMIRGGTRPPF